MDKSSRHNLPEQPYPLLGRDQVLSEAQGLLCTASVRMLSLIGPPGVGKTRLALALAENVLADFPEGVWVVDLAALPDPLLIGAEIAQTLGIASVRAEASLDSLAAYFRERQVLLCLDNFDRILPAAAWVGKLLERTTRLKVLVTSRERLRLRWERTLLIPPLPLPDLNQPADLSALSENPAFALFVQRAGAVNPGFRVPPEAGPVIARICRHLDGLPLAIELAAARANILSPAEILAHLDNRFHLLGMGAPDLPRRQQTLKAAIDWSYELLQPAEQQFLRQLAVFAGGFSLAAAEAVASAAGESSQPGLDELSSLISLAEKSLLSRIQAPAGQMRFSMLESIREYLLNLLIESGEAADARQRHALYYLAFVEGFNWETRKKDQKTWFDALETEHDNIRLALQWSVDTGQYAVGRHIAAAVGTFWWLHGHAREGAGWFEIFLENDQGQQDDTHWALVEGAGLLHGWQKHTDKAMTYLMDALADADSHQNQIAIARLIGELGLIFWINGMVGQITWLEERLSAPLPDADEWDLAYAHLGLGCLYYDTGQLDAAEQALARSLSYFTNAGEKHGFAFATSKLALIQNEKGSFQNSQRGMLEAINTAGQAIDLHIITFCVDNAVQWAASQLERHKFTEAQQRIKIVQGLGAVDAWRDIYGMPRTPHEKVVYEQMTGQLRQQLGEPAFLNAWQAGQSMRVEAVLDHVASLIHDQSTPKSDDLPAPSKGDHHVMLSQRELQVIQRIAEGLSNQEIAGQLFITERTVRFHVTSIMNKLGASNRTQAVMIANRTGLL